jgi:hypothetical protein
MCYQSTRPCWFAKSRNHRHRRPAARGGAYLDLASIGLQPPLGSRASLWIWRLLRSYVVCELLAFRLEGRSPPAPPLAYPSPQSPSSLAATAALYHLPPMGGGESAALCGCVCQAKMGLSS